MGVEEYDNRLKVIEDLVDSLVKQIANGEEPSSGVCDLTMMNCIDAFCTPIEEKLAIGNIAAIGALMECRRYFDREIRDKYSSEGLGLSALMGLKSRIKIFKSAAYGGKKVRTLDGELPALYGALEELSNKAPGRRSEQITCFSTSDTDRVSENLILQIPQIIDKLLKILDEAERSKSNPGARMRLTDEWRFYMDALVTNRIVFDGPRVGKYNCFKGELQQSVDKFISFVLHMPCSSALYDSQKNAVFATAGSILNPASEKILMALDKKEMEVSTNARDSFATWARYVGAQDMIADQKRLQDVRTRLQSFKTFCMSEDLKSCFERTALDLSYGTRTQKAIEKGFSRVDEPKLTLLQKILRFCANTWRWFQNFDLSKATSRVYPQVEVSAAEPPIDNADMHKQIEQEPVKHGPEPDASPKPSGLDAVKPTGQPEGKSKGNGICNIL